MNIDKAIKIFTDRGYVQFKDYLKAENCISMQKRLGVSGVCEINDNTHITVTFYDYTINRNKFESYEIDVYLQYNGVSFTTKAYGNISDLDKIDFIEESLSILPNNFKK